MGHTFPNPFVTSKVTLVYAKRPKLRYHGYYVGHSDVLSIPEDSSRLWKYLVSGHHDTTYQHMSD